MELENAFLQQLKQVWEISLILFLRKQAIFNSKWLFHISKSNFVYHVIIMISSKCWSWLIQNKPRRYSKERNERNPRKFLLFCLFLDRVIFLRVRSEGKVESADSWAEGRINFPLVRQDLDLVAVKFGSH